MGQKAAKHSINLHALQYSNKKIRNRSGLVHQTAVFRVPEPGQTITA